MGADATVAAPAAAADGLLPAADFTSAEVPVLPEGPLSGTMAPPLAAGLAAASSGGGVATT